MLTIASSDCALAKIMVLASCERKARTAYRFLCARNCFAVMSVCHQKRTSQKRESMSSAKGDISLQILGALTAPKCMALSVRSLTASFVAAFKFLGRTDSLSCCWSALLAWCEGAALGAQSQ